MRAHYVLPFLILSTSISHAALFENFDCPSADDDGNPLTKAAVNTNNLKGSFPVLCLYKTSSSSDVCSYSTNGSLAENAGNTTSCPSELVTVARLASVPIDPSNPLTTTPSLHTIPINPATSRISTSRTTSPTSVEPRSHSLRRSQTTPAPSATSLSETSTATAPSSKAPADTKLPGVKRPPRISRGAIVGIVVAVLGFLLCVVFILVRITKRMNARAPRQGVLEEGTTPFVEDRAESIHNPPEDILVVGASAGIDGQQDEMKRLKSSYPGHPDAVQAANPPGGLAAGATPVNRNQGDDQREEILSRRARSLEAWLEALSHPELPDDAPPEYTG
ncbi:hypothetical protein B0H16DRAFT_1591960 [Mycena metata]|uniref:Uncharacterized protein n=1 Tax=Mycena metata TaxID=1033252 RepID=A0AAD7HRK8_9AGAR|nr:hypothetical protein B0H16DRAFT_1591960 [Mycena metata]